MTAPIPIAEELLTEADVIRRIPGRDADVRAWLRGLRIALRGPTGILLYRWSAVLSRLPSADYPIFIRRWCAIVAHPSLPGSTCSAGLSRPGN